MDPNATLRDIISSFRSSQWMECIEACTAMSEWLVKGGFPPGAFSRADVIGFTVVMAQVACSQIGHEEE